jgi:hypothetical protein
VESTRKQDIIVEREVAKFLDENLYNNSDIFKEFLRTPNREEQLLGYDVMLSTWDGRLKWAVVDEKVAARYANKKLGTFALEISFLNKSGKEIVGWLIDEKKKTEYYLCGWITKSDIPYDEEKKRYLTEELTKDNIISMDWCLVSRDKILKHLESLGWTIDKIKRQSDKIRKNDGVSTNKFIDGVTFRYSNNLAEKPINLLMWKSTYFKISDYSGKITVNKK